MDAKKGFGLAALAAVVALGLAFASCDSGSGSGAGAITDEQRLEGRWAYDREPREVIVISGNIMKFYWDGDHQHDMPFTVSNGIINGYDYELGKIEVPFAFSNNYNTLTLLFPSLYSGYSVFHRQP